MPQERSLKQVSADAHAALVGNASATWDADETIRQIGACWWLDHTVLSLDWTIAVKRLMTIGVRSEVAQEVAERLFGGAT